MANLSVLIRCMKCGERLKCPDNEGIVPFTILFLQFHEFHSEVKNCEKIMMEKEKQEEQQPNANRAA